MGAVDLQSLQEVEGYPVFADFGFWKAEDCLGDLFERDGVGFWLGLGAGRWLGLEVAFRGEEGLDDFGGHFFVGWCIGAWGAGDVQKAIALLDQLTPPTAPTPPSAKGLEIAQCFNRNILHNQLNPNGSAVRQLAKMIDQELEQQAKTATQDTNAKAYEDTLIGLEDPQPEPPTV